MHVHNIRHANAHTHLTMACNMIPHTHTHAHTGALWVINQFFAVSLAQHGMLVGLTMPLEYAMAADK